MESQNQYANKSGIIFKWTLITQGAILVHKQEAKAYLRLARSAIRVRTEQLEDTWLLAEEPSKGRRNKF